MELPLGVIAGFQKNKSIQNKFNYEKRLPFGYEKYEKFDLLPTKNGQEKSLHTDVVW